MTTTSEAESKRFNRLSCLIIILAGLIVYSNTIHSSFHFDDSVFVDDPLARDLRNVPRFFQENDISLPSRGLVTASLAVNYYFSGLSVEGYHWTNISIHLMNGVLVYFLMLIILGEYVSGGGAGGPDGDIHRARVLALFVALLFITSPIQTHSVTYIIKRYAPMASFFCLLSLLLFIRAVDGHGIRVYAYAGSVLSFLFAIWCKETAYTAPVIMFLYYLCFIEDGWRASLRAFKLLTPYLLLAVVSFYVSMPLGDERISPNWGRWEYLLTQSGVLIEYAKLLLLPIPGRLNVDYDVRLTETLWRVPTLTAAITVIAVLTTAVLSLRRARLPAFCAIWFLVILAPTSSIIPLPEIMVTYRLYLAGLAFYLLLVVGIHGLFSYLGAQKGLDPKRVWQAEQAVLTGIVLFYGVCAYQHNKVWATEITLWEDTVKKSPGKVRPHFNLGHAYQSDGQVERAKAEYKICVELYNSASFNTRNKVEMDCCGRAFTNLGDVYLNETQYKRAIPLLETAREISRYNGKAHSCLGMAYVMTGRLSEGEDELSLALRIEPTDVRAHIGFGVLYEKKDMPDEAITAYTNAVGADPANETVHVKLSQLWINHGNEPGKAIRHLQEARELCTDRETSRKIEELMESIKLKGAAQRPPAPD